MPSIDVLRELRTNPADGFRRGLDLGLRSGFGSDWLGIAAQKVVLDGGMQVETARMSSVRGHRQRRGVAAGPEEMLEAVVDGHRAGWRMALHAIGDAALDLAIEALEKAQAAWPRQEPRHRIEHGGVIRDDQLPRLGALGVAVVSQPSFLFDYGDRYASQLGPERTPWLYRGRSLLDHGIRLVGSSDRPLPGPPLRVIQTLVDRTSTSGRVIGPDERIDLPAALEAVTTSAAWALGREDRLGRSPRGPRRPDPAGPQSVRRRPHDHRRDPRARDGRGRTDVVRVRQVRRRPYRSAQPTAQERWATTRRRPHSGRSLPAM